MREYFNNYAQVIVDSFLRLEKDDQLFLYTKEVDMDLARLIADKAMEKTENIVKLVILDSGKVTDVLDLEPPCRYSKAKGPVMLHIEHVFKTEQQNGKILDTLVEKDDYPAFQKLGHLADPQIPGRMITVPWCNVFVYDDPEEETSLIKKLNSDIDSAILGCNYRKQYFEHADVHQFSIKGEKSEFGFIVPEDSQFPCGSTNLPGGRSFVSGLDFSLIKIPVDRNSFNGSFDAFFEVMGRKQSGRFVFNNGKITDCPDSKELKYLLSLEENLSRVGYLVMGDGSCSVFLGAGAVATLPPGTEELPDYFNECPLKIELIINEKLSGIITDCEGKDTEIIRKGFFLE